VAILLLLLSIFALWGFDSGSSSVTHEPTVQVQPQVTESRPPVCSNRMTSTADRGQCRHRPVSP
jgi:hypothetical protein